MGILFIYLYNGAAGHARARQGQLLPYLAARSVQKCVSVCGLIRNDVPASCVCLQLATAVLLIFQTALPTLRIHNKFEFAGSISEQ
ncbi:hypothetical protein [Caballeronia sp. M23-90]